jgi:hypothetical protein
MVEVTKKGNNLLVDSIDHIHASSLLMEDNYTRKQELLFLKPLKYFKAQGKDIKQNQENMAKVITNLVKAMSMAFMRATQKNNTNNSNLVQAPKDINIVNDN